MFNSLLIKVAPILFFSISSDVGGMKISREKKLLAKSCPPPPSPRNYPLGTATDVSIGGKLEISPHQFLTDPMTSLWWRPSNLVQRLARSRLPRSLWQLEWRNSHDLNWRISPASNCTAGNQTTIQYGDLHSSYSWDHGSLGGQLLPHNVSRSLSQTKANCDTDDIVIHPHAHRGNRESIQPHTRLLCWNRSRAWAMSLAAFSSMKQLCRSLHKHLTSSGC